MPPAHFKQWVKRYHAAGLQLAMHGNGDAAIDLIIESLTEAYESAGTDGDYRHIVVHGQTMREDQLAKLATLKATVSFFPAHTWYWGDWYRFDVLGEQRAASISPLAAAEALGVRYTVHSDAPVTSIDPFQIIWSSTERKTRSGFVLGAKLAVGRQRVLEAMTIDAAWQNHIENDRGSLTVGKLADMVVLSDDPLTIDDVRNLRVNRVWIGGKLMFSAR
jgi:predicted amidohydrolase YtcJ